MQSKTIQIGVMGSMADVKLKETGIKIAKELGIEIAKKNALLVFGFEGDFNSFSTIAAMEAEKQGGETVAFLWGKKGTDTGILRSIRVETGQQRGGGREFSLVLSCDAIICLGGGSGTLTEIAIAYQAEIPIIVIKNTGGWSDKLADTFLDDRKRALIHGVQTPAEAIRLLIKLIRK